MAVPQDIRTEYDSLMEAAQHSQLACVECSDPQTGKPVYVLVVVYPPDAEHSDYFLKPVARMLDPDDPRDEVIPPQ